MSQKKIRRSDNDLSPSNSLNNVTVSMASIGSMNASDMNLTSLEERKETFFEVIQTYPFFWRLVVLGLAMVWASNFSVIKTILKEPGLDPAIYAAVRFTLGSIALLPQTVASFNNRDLASRGMSIGFCIFIAYVGQAMGMLTSTANKSAFICSMNVVWVALVTSVLNKKCNIQVWFSVLLAVIGAGFMELRGSTPPAIGDLWLLLQPIGFGTGYILLESLMKQYPDAAGAVSGFKVIAVALSCILWAIVTGHSIEDLLPIFQSPVAMGGLLYTGFITTACCVWVQSIAFKRVQAADASIILSTEPLWAAVFASFLLGESLSFSDMVGGAFIIFATISNEFNFVNTLLERLNKPLKEKIDAESDDPTLSLIPLLTRDGPSPANEIL